MGRCDAGIVAEIKFEIQIKSNECYTDQKSGDTRFLFGKQVISNSFLFLVTSS